MFTDINSEGLKAVIVRLAVRDTFMEIFAKNLPGVEVFNGQNPAFIKYEKLSDMPVFAIGGPDTGFLEDIGLISYSMNSDMLLIESSKRKEWLTEYGNLERKEDRVARLNKIHFESLMDPVIVPLAVAPYVALATKDWNIELSNQFANNQLWLFTHN